MQAGPSSRTGVYTDDSIYGSLYYGKVEEDRYEEDRYTEDGYGVEHFGFEDEAQYEYLSEEDRNFGAANAAVAGTAASASLSRVSSSGSLPPPLPPPNRRRSSLTEIHGSHSPISPDAYMHGIISRLQAEEILSEDMRNGAFLLRIKVPDEEWALSMVWKGMFVHHLIRLNLDSRQFTINDEPFPQEIFSITELIAYLRAYQSDAFRVIEQDLRHPLGPR